MIYYSIALFAEAKPLIKRLNLKKDNKNSKFQIFHNPSHLLVITGTGAISAAAGTTYLLALYPPSPGDVFLNIGICGTSAKQLHKGQLCIASKITDLATGRCVYPELLYCHPFLEYPLHTAPRILSADTSEGLFLADLEAFSIYQCACVFFKSSHIFILKVVADHLADAGQTPREIPALVNKSLGQILNWLDQLKALTDQPEPAFTDEELALTDLLGERLCLSETMRHQLKQLLWYERLRHGQLNAFLKHLIKNIGPNLNKKEGKQQFEAIRQQITYA